MKSALIKILLLTTVFNGALLAFPVSNDEFASSILHQLWPRWIAENREVTNGFEVTWDEQDELAAYIGTNLSEWIISRGLDQRRDREKSVILSLQNCKLDFTVSKADVNPYGIQRYKREMEIQFDMSIVEKETNSPLRSDHFSRSASDIVEEDELSFIVDDAFVVEPRLKFPVSSLSMPRMVIISTITILIASLLYFIRS
ncbi:MAG: hypothetical protein K9N34_00120 [Candidatus Marinimicrobia bacterium]|nr:hypothetical protein [Candidatus Neomarinimicrobiota bacterium]MCF7839164.1 hypothetical protein [Candidatus Neomarinimicrobiota bacterium]